MKFRKAVATSKRKYGKLLDSMHENETNFTAKRCDVDSLVSTGGIQPIVLDAVD